MGVSTPTKWFDKLINPDRGQTLVYDSAQRGQPAVYELQEVFHYRNLILQLVRRDVLTRYKRSVLGIAWTMLNPLGMMLVLTIAFSQVFRFNTVYGYPAYVLSGLLAWTFFAQTTTAAMVNLVWGGGLLNRIYIPRASFALAAIGTGLLNITLATVPLLVVMLITRVPIRPAILFLPAPVLLLACFALGLGLLISTIAVYFPDVAEMYQIALTGWMYLTPVIYPEDILPEPFRFWITHLNPMYYLVKLYRLPVYYGRLPTWAEFWPAVLISILVLGIGWWVFSQKSDEFAYRI
jgi:ABC-type polysaccharide/polyol phosphate export permease